MLIWNSPGLMSVACCRVPVPPLVTMLGRHDSKKTWKWANYAYGNSAHDDGWHGKHNGCKDQAEFDPPQHRSMTRNQVQPRIKKPTLRNDHDQPCQVNHSDGTFEIGPYPKIGEDNEERL